jgi:hypothetical protein
MCAVAPIVGGRLRIDVRICAKIPQNAAIAAAGRANPLVSAESHR